MLANNSSAQENIFRNHREEAAKNRNDLSKFAGIETKTYESSPWRSLSQQPIPLAVIGIQLSGALLDQSVFIDKSALERVAVPVLKKVSLVFKEMESVFGMPVATLKVSKTDSEIAILSANILSPGERRGVFPAFMQHLQLVSDELKVVTMLAEMPAGKFSEAWFDKRVRPDPRLLRSLKSVLALAETLKKFKAFLVIDGQVIDLPCCTGMKLVKMGAIHGTVEGILVGLSVRPAILSVLTHDGKTVMVRANGKGLVNELNQTFRVGDQVKISYEPMVNLLNEYEEIPRKGRLVAIDHQ